MGTNGTPHLQGYIEFPNAVRGSAIRKNFDGKAHWEVRRGTAKEASDYCKKEGSYEEFGQLSQQGKRTDLEEIGDAVLSGISTKEIACTYPGAYIKYHKGIEALKQAAKGVFDFKDRTTKPKVIWRWGPTGVGKTRGAREAHTTYYIKDGTQWWDGYEQQEAIIIDDFDGKWEFRGLLRLLDFAPYQGQTKGGHVKINSPYIYFTCEYPPEQAFHNAPGEFNQIRRRIDEVIEIKSSEESKTS